MDTAKEIDDTMKDRVESYDIDAAIADLTNIIDRSSDLYYQLKKTKFEYLTQAFEMYSRIDLPSIMMIASNKNASEAIPKTKDIEEMKF